MLVAQFVLTKLSIFISKYPVYYCLTKMWVISLMAGKKNYTYMNLGARISKLSYHTDVIGYLG